MGKRAWNIVFRNITKTTCSLHGWPQIVVRTTAGKTVATTVSKVNYSNLAVVPDTEIGPARPGRAPLSRPQSATAPGRCVTRWTLGLTLPGAARPVTVPGPAGSFAPCVGGQLRLSPFYAEQTLTRDIKALSSSAAPSPFAAATGAEPATCAAAALRASVTSVADEHDGSIIELRLSNAGQACVLPEGWPTVRLDEAGGASQVAKIFPDTAAVQAGRKLLTTYQHGTTQSTALTLSPGGSVSVALFAAATGPQACQRVTSLVVYPTAAARGAGRTRPAGYAGPDLRRGPGPVVRAERSRRPGHGHRPRRAGHRASPIPPRPQGQDRLLLTGPTAPPRRRAATAAAPTPSRPAAAARAAPARTASTSARWARS